jgi:hypothetical protein
MHGIITERDRSLVQPGLPGPLPPEPKPPSAAPARSGTRNSCRHCTPFTSTCSHGALDPRPRDSQSVFDPPRPRAADDR